ncbi:MAG: flippase-like domain-containing protein [Saprospiraceae bacterium]|nr:flippase-like domain-containing protein [Saprospiraceae bacterium]
MKSTSKRWLGGVGILISGVLLFLVFRTVDFEEVRKTLQLLNAKALIVVCLVYLLMVFVRAYRWRLTLPNHKNYLNSIVMGLAGNNVLPARGGELLQMEYFRLKNNDQHRVTIITSIATLKILDGICLLSLLYFSSKALLSANSPNWLNALLMLSLPILLILLLLLIVLRWKGEVIRQYLSQFSTQFIIWCVGLLRNMEEALAFLHFNQQTLWIVLSTYVIWCLEGIMFMVCLAVFQIPDPLLLGLFTLCVVNFGIATPSSPGYFGVFQAATLLALSPFEVSNEIALSIGLIVNFFQFYLLLYGE